MVASLLKVISSGIQDERLTFKHTLFGLRLEDLQHSGVV